MSETLLCAECDGPISEVDAVWHRPFARAERVEGGALQMEGEISTSDNGGLVLHRACLEKRLGRKP